MMHFLWSVARLRKIRRNKWLIIDEASRSGAATRLFLLRTQVDTVNGFRAAFTVITNTSYEVTFASGTFPLSRLVGIALKVHAIQLYEGLEEISTHSR